MSVLIFSTEEPVRNSLHLFCTNLGYTNISAFSDLERAMHFLEASPKTQLIVSSWTPEGDELIYTLTKSQELHPELSLIPFIQVLPYRPIARLFKSSAALSSASGRVDECLIRPFAKIGFRNAVQKAYEKRILRKETLLVVGDNNLRHSLLQFLWTRKNPTYHWKNVLVASEAKEIEACIETHSSQIGTVLIAPERLTKEAKDVLTRYKKQPIAHQAPIVTLSHQPEFVGLTRSLSNLFIELSFEAGPETLNQQLGAILHVTSQRMAKQWITQRLLQRSIMLLKVEHAKKHAPKKRHPLRKFFFGHEKPLRLLNYALKIDPDRWEVHEALGRLFMKRGHLKQAVTHSKETLKTNPCSPRAHLALVELLGNSIQEGPEILRNADAYCPNLPELQEQVKKHTKAA